MNSIPCILTIAGSDSGGGAGIQADLKTIAMHGAYGASVITALTAQNTTGVSGIHAPSAEFVAQQLKAVLDDIKFSAAKTGMLFSTSIIRTVAKALIRKDFPLVVDPVCVAQSGDPLMREDSVQSMSDYLFPLADLLTPNIPEAEQFTGMTIRTQEDIAQAIKKLLDMGPKAVLIKGGHLDSVASTDWYASRGQEAIPFMQQRIDTKNNHGTGCTLSAAIASNLGQGMEMSKAVREAQKYLNLALRAGFDIGHGSGPPNHLAPMFKQRSRGRVLEELAEMGRSLKVVPDLCRLMPESRMNLVLAMPFADTEKDVAAFDGRITCSGRGEVLVPGCPEYGASSRMSRVLLSARKVNPDIMCGLNIRLVDEVLAAMREGGLEVAWFDRAEEPVTVGKREESTLEWGAYQAMSNHPHPETVTAICDRGEAGKEPMVRLLAKNGADLLDMLSIILKGYSRG